MVTCDAPTRRPVANPRGRGAARLPLVPAAGARSASECRAEHPGWWNAPVPAFGDRDAWLAIVGLAPGKHGANRTGRPFTGDYAGDLLYATLPKFGLAEGEYGADPGDGLQLKGAIILNAVKCLPPANKPEPRGNRDLPALFRGRAGGAAEGARGHRARARSPMSPRRARSACRRHRPNSAMAPSTSRPTAASCCRAIIARATTRIRAGSMRRCSKAFSNGRW